MFLSVEGKVELEQSCDKEEGGIAPIGAPEVFVTFHQFHLVPDHADDVDLEWLAAARGRDARDVKAGDQACDCQAG